MAAIHLPDRALIALSGEDAEHFLQNLITTDIAGIGDGVAWAGGLLTPQGKFLFDFLVSRTPDGFRLETSKEDADQLLKRLIFYRLRAKVEIESAGNDGVTVFVDDGAPEDAVVDERFRRAGMAIWRKAGRHGDTDHEAYTALRIRAGVAEMHADFTPQDAFPHDVLYDCNGGVSFRRGCYIGQEVVSRMQHRGTARRRLVEVVAKAPLPVPGTPLTAAGKQIGALGSVANNKAMAIVRIDRVANAIAAGEPIFADTVTVDIATYPWSGVTLATADSKAGETE